MNEDRIKVLSQLSQDIKAMKEDVESGLLDGYLIVCHFRGSEGSSTSSTYASSIHATTLLGFVRVAEDNMIRSIQDEHKDRVSSDVQETLRQTDINNTNRKLN